MANPVKDTPILKGQEAEKFLDNLARRFDKASTEQGISEQKNELKRLENSYKSIRSISGDCSF